MADIAMAQLLNFVYLNINATMFNPIMGPALIHIANTYFEERERVFLDFTGGEGLELVSSMLSQQQTAAVALLTPPLPVLEVQNASNTDIIIILGNSMVPARNMWRTLKWNPRGRLLVIAHDISARRIQGVSRSIWLISGTKNLVTASLHGTSMDLYTWLPYKPKECGEVRNVTLIDQFLLNDNQSDDDTQDTELKSAHGGRFVKRAYLFPQEQITDMHDCPVSAAVVNSEPYVIDQQHGIEIKVIQILQQYFNFRLEFTHVDPRDFYLAKIWNGSEFEYNGAFKLLYYQEIDIAFSGLSATVDRYEASLPLMPHLMEAIRWSAPAPLIVSPLHRTFRIFSPQLILCFTFAFLILNLLVYVSQVRMPLPAPTHLRAPLRFRATHSGKLRRIRIQPKKPSRQINDVTTTVMYTLSVTISGMPYLKPFSSNFRAITLLMLVLSMHQLIAYQSSLIYLLTVPIAEPAFESVHELVQAGLTCYSYRAGLRLVTAARNDGSFVPGSCFPIEDMSQILERVAHERDCFFLFPETPLFFMTSGQNDDDDHTDLLMQLPQPFMVLPISFHMSPGNTLAKPFNRKIQQIVQAGIVRYWDRMIRFGAALKDRSHDEDDEHVEIAGKRTQLSMAHLQGIFFIHSGLLILAGLVFAAELWRSPRY